MCKSAQDSLDKKEYMFAAGCVSSLEQLKAIAHASVDRYCVTDFSTASLP